jgi:hypothetical protein
VSGAAQTVVAVILIGGAMLLMGAIIWFRWKFWDDRP